MAMLNIRIIWILNCTKLRYHHKLNLMVGTKPFPGWLHSRRKAISAKVFSAAPRHHASSLLCSDEHLGKSHLASRCDSQLSSIAMPCYAVSQLVMDSVSSVALSENRLLQNCWWSIIRFPINLPLPDFHTCYISKLNIVGDISHCIPMNVPKKTQFSMLSG